MSPSEFRIAWTKNEQNLQPVSTDEDFDTDFTNEQFDALYAILQSIDQRAVREGFWKEELDLLLENREDARRNH